MVALIHKDQSTIIDVQSTEYGNKKVVIGQHAVKGTFLQNTGFLHSNNQDAIEADAVFYPNHKDAFVIASYNRLEGMYIIVSPYGAPDADSWYKITSVRVNRDHLLSNKIDNIQLLLKKTDALEGVS